MDELLSNPALLTGGVVLAILVLAFIRGDVVPGYIYKQRIEECEERETRIQEISDGWQKLALEGKDLADDVIQRVKDHK